MYLLRVKIVLLCHVIRKYKLTNDHVNSGIISELCRWLNRSIYGPRFAYHHRVLVCLISKEARCAEDEEE